MSNTQTRQTSPIARPISQNHMLPSRRKLALALAVVKSKPPEISLDDFLQQIHHHIQNRPRPLNPPNQRHHHLDSATFWRLAYEKSEATQSKLLDVIYELEQKIEVSKVGANGSKRKGDEADLTDTRKAGAKKQAKGSQRGGTRSKTGNGVSGKDEDEEEGWGRDDGTAILRQLYQLKRVLGQRRPESEVLAAVCVKLCRAAESVIWAPLRDGVEETSDVKSKTPFPPPSLKGQSARVGDRSHDLTTVFAVIQNQGGPAILQGLKKLITLDNDRKSQGKVIHALVSLFQSNLIALHTIFMKNCKEIVETEKQSRTRKPTAKGRKQTIKTTKNLENATKPLDPQTPKLISKSLCRMITSLDPARPETSELLEGYLCCLLDHIGKRLCRIVFGQDEIRADSIRKEGGPKTRARGLGDDLRDEIKRKAAEGEGRHLTRILRRALDFAGANQHLLSTEVQNGDWKGDVEPAFLHIVKERLQKTLLKGVFGGDELFRDSMTGRMAEGSDSEAELDQVEEDPEEEPGDRFTREVWELVGWDILERAIGFEEEEEEEDDGEL